MTASRLRSAGDAGATQPAKVDLRSSRRSPPRFANSSSSSRAPPSPRELLLAELLLPCMPRCAAGHARRVAAAGYGRLYRPRPQIAVLDLLRDVLHSRGARGSNSSLAVIAACRWRAAAPEICAACSPNHEGLRHAAGMGGCSFLVLSNIDRALPRVPRCVMGGTGQPRPAHPRRRHPPLEGVSAGSYRANSSEILVLARAAAAPSALAAPPTAAPPSTCRVALHPQATYGDKLRHLTQLRGRPPSRAPGGARRRRAGGQGHAAAEGAAVVPQAVARGAAVRRQHGTAEAPTGAPFVDLAPRPTADDTVSSAPHWRPELVDEDHDRGRRLLLLRVGGRRRRLLRGPAARLPCGSVGELPRSTLRLQPTPTSAASPSASPSPPPPPSSPPPPSPIPPSPSTPSPIPPPPRAPSPIPSPSPPPFAGVADPSPPPFAPASPIPSPSPFSFPPSPPPPPPPLPPPRSLRPPAGQKRPATSDVLELITALAPLRRPRTGDVRRQDHRGDRGDARRRRPRRRVRACAACVATRSERIATDDQRAAALAAVVKQAPPPAAAPPSASPSPHRRPPSPPPSPPPPPQPPSSSWTSPLRPDGGTAPSAPSARPSRAHRRCSAHTPTHTALTASTSRSLTPYSRLGAGCCWWSPSASSAPGGGAEEQGGIAGRRPPPPSTWCSSA